MSGLKPEERAREWIDRKLEDAGWQVINRDEYSPGMTAVAVREAAMRGGLEADYLLLINGKAAAVLEAKREEIALDNPHLIAQAENYTKQVQPWYPTWELPLPFVYLSNGKEIAFKFGHTRRLASEKLMPCIRSYPSGSEDSGPCRYGRPRVMR